MTYDSEEANHENDDEEDNNDNDNNDVVQFRSHHLVEPIMITDMKLMNEIATCSE